MAGLFVYMMSRPRNILLSTAYFAPVSYYSRLIEKDTVPVIERHEHYNKQSYRNRCTIYSANGLLDLTVPVVRSVAPKCPVTDVRISYDTPWQKLHYKAIESAYRRSPFYEYYIDDLLPFFNRHDTFLYDFNMKILESTCRMLSIPFRIQESSSYIRSSPGTEDLRDKIHPKKRNDSFRAQKYVQVFDQKMGFQPDLSIIDLIFNEGPQSIDYLATETCKNITPIH